MKKVSHKEKPVEQRIKECTDIMLKYPDRICIYVEKRLNCKTLPDLEKNKYLVPRTITAAQFIFVIRSKLNIKKDTALFFYINNNIISGTMTVDEFYDKYKNLDGFLYIEYTAESCFG